MMVRLRWSMLFLGFVLPALLLAQQPAAKPTVEGRWKLKVAQGEETLTFLLAFSKTDTGWVGDFLSCTAQLKAEPKIEKVIVKDDTIKFSMAFGGREFVNFDGMLSKDGTKLLGSITTFGGTLQPGELVSSQLKKVDDPFELARESFMQTDSGTGIFDTGFVLLSQATTKKLPAEEVRAVVDKLTKTAANYGPRWEQTTTLKLSRTLADQEGQAEIALAQIRRAERMLPDDAPLPMQLETFELAAKLLTKTGKEADAKKYLANVAKLEAKDYADFQKTILGFKVEPFAGRKVKSDRATVVEVLSSVDASPCTGIDLATTSLGTHYKATEVIALCYHVHAPNPDPLTSPEGMERIALYAEQIRTMPTVLINGKLQAIRGGAADSAPTKLKELQDLINPTLETANTTKITLTAMPTDKGFSAKAIVDVETPSDKIKLRFVLSESQIRYAGTNGVRYHANIVRDLPGGAAGVAITKKNQEASTIINLDDLRKKLSDYLTDHAKTEGEFPHGIPALKLTNLQLIALVQNDATGEILHAVQVPLTAAK